MLEETRSQAYNAYIDLILCKADKITVGFIRAYIAAIIRRDSDREMSAFLFFQKACRRLILLSEPR